MNLSEHLTFKKIFKATIFPIIMMIFTSLYSIVDGLFISNFANESSFAAVNLVMPFIMIIGSIGFMMGAGGTALVSRYLGQRDQEKANNSFSLIVYATIVIGLVISILGFFFIVPIIKALGSINNETSPEMVSEAITYGRIIICFLVFFMLQHLFQSFFLVAGKPKLGFFVILAGGITNIILDALFIGVFKWGVVGAAVATSIGYIITSTISVLYFVIKRNGVIVLGKATFKMKPILRSAYNGLSEFISNISMSVVSIVYNIQLLRLYGENGVSAYGIIMYVSFVFIAIFIGFSIGVAPFVGYNFGAENNKELKNILKKSLLIIFITGIIMMTLSLITAPAFAGFFSNGNADLKDLSTTAMRICSLCFLFSGISIFTSSFFTALNNGTISAAISMLRTLVFQVAFVFIIPLIVGSIGIWWSNVGAEAVSFGLCIIFLLAQRKKYHY